MNSQLLNKLTLSGYVTKRKITKTVDGVDYEIQFFQGIHSNEYLVSQISNGVYNGVSQLFDNGIIQYSCTFENGVRKGNVTTFKNGVADAVRTWESILSQDEEDRAIENRSIGLLMVIRDKETNRIIYEGGFNSENHRNGYGFEFDRDSGDRQRYCYFEDDMVIQIICEFNGDKMIEYWIHEKDSNTKPYQKHPVYIGGFNIINQQIVRHGEGVVIDALTGLAVFSGSWVNGVAINGYDLSDGWFCEGKKEVSLKMVVDEQTFELLEKQKAEEEEELKRKKEEEELRQQKEKEEEKLKQQQEAAEEEEVADIAEESIDVTITNVHDLEMLTPAVMLLITANNSCNSSITSLRLCEYPQLREIRIGDNCFKKVIIVKIMKNPLLESIIIGNNSFTYDKDTIEEDKTSILTISDNPLLSKILIDYLSFACFYTPVFENLPQLQTLIIGQLQQYSTCFYYGSLQLMNLPLLETVIVGNACFGRAEATIFENLRNLKQIECGEWGMTGFRYKKKTSLLMRNLPSLVSMFSYGHTFESTSKVIIEDCPSIETVYLPNAFDNIIMKKSSCKNAGKLEDALIV